MSISACIYVSCENSEIEPINNSNCIIDIKGADEFKNSLRDLSGKAISRSGCDDPLAEDIETLIEISHEFLERNEIALDDLNIENGEDASVGALRELREETGFVPKEMIEMDSFYQDEGCSAALNHIYLALDCEKKFEQELDKDEIVKYMMFNYEELLELENMGYIKGCNTKLALEKSKVYMKGR